MKLKKLASLLLAGSMIAGLVACGGNTDTPATSDAPAADNTPKTIEEVWPKGTTVTIDVPAKAGGGTDIFTRYLTQALSEVYPDANFVVNNYDTTEVGREHTKNADGDGLTLIAHHGGWILEYLSGSTNVNPKDDLKCVSVANLGGPQAIIAKPNAPYTNFTELGEYIAAHPGEVVIGCSLGGASQGAIYKVIEGLGEGYADMVNWVQCSSEADKLTQTASGSIDIANCSIPNAQSYEADGKLTILGTSAPSSATLESMSELVGLDLGDSFKTTGEQGIEDGAWDSCYYIWAPNSTPDSVCEAINEVINKATATETYQNGMKTMAAFTAEIDYAETQTRFAAEWDSMDSVAEGMGIKTR